MNGAKGVDLSHFNVTVDFGTMKKAGIGFVYLKATQGTGYVDPTFATRRRNVHVAGLACGAYHFFDPRVPGAAQAEHFLSILGELQPGELAPAIDLESTTGWDLLSQAERVQEVEAFIAAVEAELGVRVVFYCSMGWFKQFFGSSDFSGHPLWLAHYAAAAGDLGLWKAWRYWQYGQFGRVAGAGQGDVDTDVSSGPLVLAKAA